MAKAKPSLFGALQKTTDAAAAVNSEFVRQIELDKLVDNPLNRFSMREDEAFVRSMHSVEQDGFLEDLIVTPAGEGTYRIVSGHRRAAIARKLGKTRIPCKVRTYESELDEARALIGANIHKRNVTPLDMARQLQSLSDVLDRAGYPDGAKERAAQLAEQTGLSRATVERYLDLLRLNETLAAWVEQNEISMVDAYELARKKNVPLQDAVVKMAQDMAEDIPLAERVHTALEAAKRGELPKKPGASPRRPAPVDPCRTVDSLRKAARRTARQIEKLPSKNVDRDALSDKLDQYEQELESLLAACRALRDRL